MRPRPFLLSNTSKNSSRKIRWQLQHPFLALGRPSAAWTCRNVTTSSGAFLLGGAQVGYNHEFWRGVIKLEASRLPISLGPYDFLAKNYSIGPSGRKALAAFPIQLVTSCRRHSKTVGVAASQKRSGDGGKDPMARIESFLQAQRHA